MIPRVCGLEIETAVRCLTYHDTSPKRSSFHRLRREGHVPPMEELVPGLTPRLVQQYCHQAPSGSRSYVRGRLIQDLDRLGLEGRVNWHFAVVEDEVIELLDPLERDYARVETELDRIWTRKMSAKATPNN